MTSPNITSLETVQFAWGGLFDSEPTDGNIIHLMAVERKLPNGKLGTLCDIDMFNKMTPGWSRGGGVIDRGIQYQGCPECLTVAKAEFPGALAIGAKEFTQPINAELQS